MKKVSIISKLLLIAGLALPFGQVYAGGPEKQVSQLSRLASDYTLSPKTQLIIGGTVVGTIAAYCGLKYVAKKVDEKIKGAKQKIETTAKRTLFGIGFGVAAGFVASCYPFVGWFVSRKTLVGTGALAGSIVGLFPNSVWNVAKSFILGKKQKADSSV